MQKITPTQARNSKAYIQNHVCVITARVFRSLDDYYNEELHTHHVYSYGLRDITFWNVSTQQHEQLSLNEDKFTVQSPYSNELAKTEFWARFRKYCITRFGFMPRIEFRTN